VEARLAASIESQGESLKTLDWKQRSIVTYGAWQVSSNLTMRTITMANVYALVGAWLGSPSFAFRGAAT
jgi:hypothetical protein